MSEPKTMPSYWALAREVTHLNGQLEKLKAENAKLRNARDMWQENDAKLRELVRHLYECTLHNTCRGCKYDDETCDFVHAMHDMGMRVN